MQPIYHQISDRIEAYIAENRITGRLPGVLKLSRELGLNRVTLHKAIQELEKRGVVTIQGTRGTFVLDRSRNERPRYKAIGLAGGQHGYDGYSFLLERLNRIAQRYDYQVIGISYDTEVFEKDIEILAHFPVDGIIFTLSSLTRKIAEFLDGKRIVYNCCNLRPDLPGIDSCDADHEQGYGEVLDRLRRLGHRHIALLEFDRSPDYLDYLVRLKNIFRAHLGADFREELFYTPEEQLAAYRKKGKEKLYVEYVRSGLDYFFNLKVPPTAIIAPTLLAMEIFRQYGGNIPADLSLVGMFSNSSAPLAAEISIMSLTMDSLREWALTRILERLHGNDLPPEQYLIPMKLHSEITMGPPPAKSRFRKPGNTYSNKSKEEVLQ